MRELHCEFCGTVYNARSKSRFCSHKCYLDSSRKKIVCPWCGNEFIVPKSQNRIFCSYSCNGFYYSSLKNGIEQLKDEKKSIQWSEGIAYLSGLIATDGTLRKYRNTIRIASKDMQQLENVQNIVCNEITGRKNKIIPEYKKVNSRTFITNSYQFTSKIFYEFCRNIGIMPDKSLVLGSLNIPQEYFSHFLRGVIDGDGNYNILKRRYEFYEINHIHIRIVSGSFLFLNWLNDESSRIFNIQNGTIYEESQKHSSNKKYTLFWSSRKPVNAIIENIYSKCEYFLERKKALVDRAEIENNKFSDIKILRQLYSFVPKNNTSGVKGVSYCKRTKKWVAYIAVEHKQKFLGYFNDLEDAAIARKNAESNINLLLEQKTDLL